MSLAYWLSPAVLANRLSLLNCTSAMPRALAQGTRAKPHARSQPLALVHDRFGAGSCGANSRHAAAALSLTPHAASSSSTATALTAAASASAASACSARLLFQVI